MRKEIDAVKQLLRDERAAEFAKQEREWDQQEMQEEMEMEMEAMKLQGKVGETVGEIEKGEQTVPGEEAVPGAAVIGDHDQMHE